MKILITGSRRGLGRMIKEKLKKDHFIYGTSSKEPVNQEEGVENFYLNYKIFNTIDSLYENLKCKDLDVIIHNASIFYHGRSEILTKEEMLETFNVNFFGPIYLTNLLLNNLKYKNKSKIIIISSIASIDPWPTCSIYAASKGAMESVAFEWSVLWKKYGIEIFIIRPNPLETEMEMLKPTKQKKPEEFPIELNFEPVENVLQLISDIVNEKNKNLINYSGYWSKKACNDLCSDKSRIDLLNQYSRLFNP